MHYITSKTKIIYNFVDLPNVVLFFYSLLRIISVMNCNEHTAQCALCAVIHELRFFGNPLTSVNHAINQTCQVKRQHISIITRLCCKLFLFNFQWNKNYFSPWFNSISFGWQKFVHIKLLIFFTVKNVNVACQKHQSFSDIKWFIYSSWIICKKRNI